MTQEEKSILLQDLCARLPYGVKCNAFLKQIDGSSKSIFGTFKGYNGWATVGNNLVGIETVRPYLRPMSSMTEGEKEEFHKLKQFSVTVVMPNGVSLLKPTYIVDLEEDGDGLNHLYDWLNAHHFDYRGLIEKGLALESPEGMYNIKKK